jgi:hypothetical protein
MGKKYLFGKGIKGSLLRISLLLFIYIGSLIILLLIYSAINGDFPRDRKSIILLGPKDHPINGFGYSVPDKTKHYGVNKPGLLESLVASIKDMYMGWKYGTDYINDKYNQKNRHDRTTFTEKVCVVNPPLVNWDAKLARFCKNTGFKGKINGEEIALSSTWRERNFHYMEGSFDLAAPKDTVSFRRNADFLLKNVLAIFAGEKAKVNLNNQPIYGFKDYGYSGKKVAGYQTKYAQLLDQKIPDMSTIMNPAPDYHGVIITYNDKEKNYQIVNSLIDKPAQLPEDKIGRQTALRLAKKTLRKRTNLHASVVDTLEAEIWKGYTVNYPETKSPHYYYVQSIWQVNFPWAEYDDSIQGCDLTFNVIYTVDAFSGKVIGQYDEIF